MICHVIKHICDLLHAASPPSQKFFSRFTFSDKRYSTASCSLYKLSRIVSYDSPPYHKKAKPIVGSSSQENRSNSQKNIQQLSTEAVISDPGCYMLFTATSHPLA
ncbi:hypothetical protein YC2023_076622 [Brassica napus]